jgi:ATP-dependent Clp protease ATP-binding subunit ClpX
MKQYQRLFELENIQLKVADEVLDYIVDKAVEYNLGARGLRSICEAIMTDAMFELPSATDIHEFNLDVKYAEEKLGRMKLNSISAA